MKASTEKRFNIALLIAGIIMLVLVLLSYPRHTHSGYIPIGLLALLTIVSSARQLCRKPTGSESEDSRS